MARSATPAQLAHLEALNERLDALTADMAAVTQGWREDLASQVRALIRSETGRLDAEDLATLTLDSSTAAALITTALDAQAAAGAVEAASELDGIEPAPEEDYAGDVAVIAGVTATLLAAALALAAARAAWRLAAPGMAAVEVAERLVEYLATFTDAGTRAELGGALWAANSEGRHATFQRAPDDMQWVADEALDSNTCEPCGDVHGTVYATLAIARFAYPNGGYYRCKGGLRCRGTYRPKIDKESDAVPNVRKLTALAGQIKALTPPLDKAEKLVGQTDPWYKITNHGGDHRPEILIYEAISDWWGITAAQFVTDLRALGPVDIDVRINSEGGQVFDAIAIYNALLTHPGDVAVYVDGLAASAASFIAMAGHRITMARTARMMIHDASGISWGNAGDMRAMAELLDDLSDNIASIYAERAGGTATEWRERMQVDAGAGTWYTAEAALTAGLVDEIGVGRTPPEPADEPEDKFPADPMAGWDPKAVRDALKGAFR
jgi:ATP-dependent protease ClpP protease subunit